MKLDVYICTGADKFTEDNLVKLWHSVGWIEGSAKDPKRLLRSLENSDTVYSAWDDDRLVGLCSAITDGLNTWISYMVVDKEYQNRGIGTALLEIMIKRYDYHRIYVQTKDADKFYKQNRFKETMHSMKLDQFLPHMKG